MRRGPRGRIPEPPKGGTWYRSSNCSASPASFLSHGGTNTACGRERCNLHGGGSPGGEIGRGSSRGKSEVEELLARDVTIYVRQRRFNSPRGELRRGRNRGGTRGPRVVETQEFRPA